ncbi:Structural maintenance of chromosomes protein 6A [Cymbomonas tetramitiformis]|uniref:Structural maintenance of chromosomes protein 6A n=1 Tax=Cymbomonas tetramitiformis TaxID=36881 RepID=A0AAE0F152_9CHLO|nr:Structural maintenance of chromosomes protein 6A [Cymbomonas tetramitiformis]
MPPRSRRDEGQGPRACGTCRCRAEEVTEVLEQLKQEQARLQGQLNDLVARAEEERRQVQEKAQQKSNLSMQSGNELTKFGGPAVPKLMDLIKKNVKRFHSPPIGPVGSFIKLRPDYASAWAVAVDAAISSTFNSFIVHDFHDKGVFMDLCRQPGQRYQAKCVVYSHKHAAYTVSPHQLPNPDLLTIDHILEVSHHTVHNHLMDTANIETTVLGQDYRTATRIAFENVSPNVSSCYIKDGTRMRIQGRTQITTPNRSRHSPKLGVDHKAALAQVDTQLQEHQTELRRLEDELRLEKKDLEKINRQVNDKRKQKGQKEAAYVNAETQMEEVERDVLDETQMGGSGDVTLLQQEFEQLEAESIQLKQENETLREQLEQAEQARNEAAALVQSEQEKVTDYGARQQEANLLSESALKQEEKHKENLAKTYLILNNIQNKIAEKEKEIQDKMQQKEQLTREAEALCPWEKLQALGGIDLEMNEQKQTALQVEYEHCKKAIRKHEQQQQMSGISLEEATENFERMERKLRNTKRRIENVSKPYWRMVHLVENRSEKVKQTSKNIKRMVSHQFNSYMQKRGNFGQISVNHKNQTLEMVVKMGQHANKDGSIQAVQNTKTLSGGERSYATLSFVLSLGSETESPFRAMDEFDVFMDAANRKVAVSLLLSFAKQRVHRQFLYLTPLKVDMLDKELESGYVNCQRLQPAER